MSKNLEVFLEGKIKNLEEKLEWLVCFEVAETAPIYKYLDDRLICSDSSIGQSYKSVPNEELPCKRSSQMTYFFDLPITIRDFFYFIFPQGSEGLRYSKNWFRKSLKLIIPDQIDNLLKIELDLSNVHCKHIKKLFCQ